MIKKITDWFTLQLSDSTESSTDHTVELCTAVLFYEIMRADDKFDDAEINVYRTLLNSHFHLTELQVDDLVELTQQTATLAADFVQFTRIINAKCDAKLRRSIIDSLWKIAYADGSVDAHEEHLIRRIADLLYIPHSQFIKSKLGATQ